MGIYIKICESKVNELTVYEGAKKAKTAKEGCGLSHADAEFIRFWRVAIPRPDGCGFYDPANCPRWLLADTTTGAVESEIL